MHVRDLLEQTGYRVYDERRDGWFESGKLHTITPLLGFSLFWFKYRRDFTK